MLKKILLSILIVSFGMSLAFAAFPKIILPTKVSLPVITPPSGQYMGKIIVSISCQTPQTRIYYTTDGSNPGKNSSLYSFPFKLDVAEPITVKAVAALKSGMQSAIASESYFSVKYPDLAAGDIILAPPNTIVGQPIGYEWFLNNQSKIVPDNPFIYNMKITKDGVIFDEKTAQAMPSNFSQPGANPRVGFLGSFTPSQEGTYTITFTADINNNIIESDENNNIKSKTFYVGSAPMTTTTTTITTTTSTTIPTTTTTTSITTTTFPQGRANLAVTVFMPDGTLPTSGETCVYIWTPYVQGVVPRNLQSKLAVNGRVDFDLPVGEYGWSADYRISSGERIIAGAFSMHTNISIEAGRENILKIYLHYITP